jgi:hypothetical protein
LIWVLTLVAAWEIAWVVRRTGKLARDRPEAAEALMVARTMAIFFVAVFLMNAYGLASGTFDAWWSKTDGSAPTVWDVLPDQGALVVGTWGLMDIIASSLTRGIVLAPDPNGAVMPRLLATLESLLKRFWLAVFGFGAVFGLAGRSVVAVVLAVELLLIWAWLRLMSVFYSSRMPS